MSVVDGAVGRGMTRRAPQGTVLEGSLLRSHDAGWQNQGWCDKTVTSEAFLVGDRRGQPRSTYLWLRISGIDICTNIP